MEWTETHAAIEGALFASGNPLSIERLCQVLEAEQSLVERLIKELMDDYQFRRRGLRIVKVEDSYQMTSAPEYAGLIRDMLDNRRPDRLSPSALEVLSLVAYYQPVTRAYIEQARGVDSSYTVGLLNDRELIEECGRLDVPGRPILYRTTQNFLRAFGLESLEDLPSLPLLEDEMEQLEIKEGD